MSKKDKSSRHLLADRFADLIKRSGYDYPNGGSVFLRTKDDRKYYAVAFSSGNALSGRINIYEDNFIQIEYKYGIMSGMPVFESEMAAVSFFRTGIMLKQWEAAKKIPNKPEKKDD